MYLCCKFKNSFKNHNAVTFATRQHHTIQRTPKLGIQYTVALRFFYLLGQDIKSL